MDSKYDKQRGDSPVKSSTQQVSAPVNPSQRQITPIECVKTALMHREPDRLPLDIGGTRVTGIHIKAYREYRRRLGLAESNAEMQIRYLQLPKVEEDFRKLLKVDVESVNPATYTEESDISSDGEGKAYFDRWGCKWYMPENGNYFDLVSFPLAGAECAKDIEKYRWPDESFAPLFKDFPSQIDATVNVNRRALVLGRTCPGIYEMLHILCGYEKALMDLACNQTLTEAIMDKVLDLKLIYYKAAIERILASGVDYFIISESDDLGSQSGLILSPEMYRSLIKPRHAALFSGIKKMSGGRAFIELHCCGAIREIIPDLIESGVEILNPVQVSAAGMGDTRSLKRDFGKDIVFHGGGADSQQILPYGTPGQVRDEVKRRIEDLAPGGGFIFTPVHSIQHDVPFENFMAMIEAYKECAGQ